MIWAGIGFAGAQGIAVPAESSVIAGISIVEEPAENVSVRFLFDFSSDTAISAKLQQQVLTFFLSGLSFDGVDRWVNLTTQSPSAICAPALRDTIVGEVLLAADVQLKQDASALTDPRTSAIGKDFWDKLYARAESLGVSDVPIDQKIWIAAGTVDLQETATTARITRSGLQVKLDVDVRAAGNRGKGASQMDEYAAALMREMIVPRLQQMVDNDPRYSALRQVYRAFILADWFKKKNSAAVLAGDIATSLPQSAPAAFDKLYNQYLLSVKQGDYSITQSVVSPSKSGSDVVERQYFSGGVDFRKYTVRSVAPANDASAGSYLETVFQGEGRARVSSAYKKIKYVNAGATVASGQASSEEGLPILASLDSMEIARLLDVAVTRSVLSSL
jgi:hypothetical protein